MPARDGGPRIAVTPKEKVWETSNIMPLFGASRTPNEAGTEGLL